MSCLKDEYDITVGITGGGTQHASTFSDVKSIEISRNSLDQCLDKNN